MSSDEAAAYRSALEQVLPATLERRESVVEGCARHLAAVVEANRTLNLTRIVEPREAAVKHVLDSLLPAALLADRETVIDLGSGAGFPGLPVHLLRPDLSMVLTESVKKKAAFLQHFVAQEGWSVTVLAERAEDALKTRSCTTVIARAAGKLVDLVRHLDRVRHRFGRVLLWKGPAIGEELEAAAEDLAQRDLVARVVQEFSLPEGMGTRCILELSHRRRK